MKNNMMKKFLTMTLACAMTLSLAACGSKAESPADSPADQNTAAPTESDIKTYKVAIIKQLDHASLDEIANARWRGQKVFVETCPQYLVLDDSVYYNEDWLQAAKYVLSLIHI